MAYDGTMKAHTKVWVEASGKIVLGDFRVSLLRLIEETGSLRMAADQLHISYRQAWGKLRETERNLGTKLIDSEAGGIGGGRSRLTAEGRKLVSQYEQLSEAMNRHLQKEFPRYFKD